MFDRYRSALRAPHVARLLTTSLLARMPNGMSSLAVLLLVTRHHGYGLGGLVTGVYVAAAGVSNLALSRAADRWGARAVLLPCAFCYAGGMVGLALVPADAFVAELLVAAATGLANPPVVPIVRGAWPRLLEPEVAQVVFGLEATAQELVYMIGPALVAVVAGVTNAPTTVVLVGLLALAGTASFATAPAFAVRPDRSQRVAGARVMRGTGLPVYVALGAAITIAFNMTDVGVVAFVSGRHASAGAGLVLAVWSLGSLVGGLIFGAGRGQVDEPAVIRSVAAMGAALLLAPVAPDSAALAVILFLGGTTIAPGLARLYARVGVIAPPGHSTEAFGWVAVGLLAGSSAGAALGGLVVDSFGARTDLLLAGAVPVLGASAAHGWLRHRRPSLAAEQQLAS